MPNQFHIEMRSFRLVGWAVLCLFFGGAVAAFWSGQRWPAIGLFVFALAGLYIALGAGSFSISRDLVEHRSCFGRWQIKWSEVTSADVASSGTLVLLGASKRFVLSSPSWWPGGQRAAAVAFVMAQLTERNIVPRSSNTADYKTMKNTRVPKQ